MSASEKAQKKQYDSDLESGFSTLQLHHGHKPEKTAEVGWGWGGIGGTGARAPPIFQTSSFTFDDGQHGSDLFGLKKLGNIYTRLTNPTNSVFEDRIAKLEGGTMAVSTSSGMAAQFMTISQFCGRGDNIVAASHLYGGTYNQFKTLFPQLGIEVKFTTGNASDLTDVENKIDEKTKAIYVETIGNPSFHVPDFENIVKLAAQYELPVVCDNTFGMGGYTCRPLKHGVHVVVASATKWIGGHGTTIGGVMIDSGKFNWGVPVRSKLGDPNSPAKKDEAGNDIAKFPLINGPCKAYHGMNLWEVFGPDGPFGANIALPLRARLIGLRDQGGCQAPFGSFLLVQGLETLSLRAEAHTQNANKLAAWLAKHKKVAWVSHPSLGGHAGHANAKKYFRFGCYGAVLSFGVKGGEEAAKQVISNLELASHVANVGDAKTLVIHSFSTTHEQLSENERSEAGVLPDLIRVSVGTEDITDIQNDFDQAFKKISIKGGKSKSNGAADGAAAPEEAKTGCACDIL